MASSSSSLLQAYDVFLSFRGETRKGFVSFLYDKLVSKGVYTFKDDRKLEKGSFISPTLLKAIENSRFAIVVISANYASSSWCLDELVKIMECKEHSTLTVVPIFYEVDPSDVRKQSGSFAEAFRDHEEKFKDDLEKVQKWRKALTDVASVAGEDSRKWENEAESIQNIVRNIWNRLFSMPSEDIDDLVGIEARLKELAPLLCMESTDERRFIGIWGMAGVGKTTIATCLYSRHLHQFHAHCFIEVTGKYKTKKLQKLLLSSIFNEKDLWILRPQFNSIKARLGHLKVLIIIDNVEKQNQLEALAKSIGWFGMGSRIVITTRDKHLLVAHGVEHMYEVKCLIRDEALQLFCQYAFKQKHPKDGFEDFSLQVVHHAAGLPLALKVLGSYLCGRSKTEWESALGKLRKIPHQDVMKVLKVSYDDLDEECRSIFLHVACLYEYHGNYTEEFKNVMDACGYHTEIGIQELIDRSLVEMSYEDIEIHDLLRQMGREIMRQQSIDEPAKRQFLMSISDVYEVLTNHKVAGAVKGISIYSDDDERDAYEDHRFSILDDKAFERTPNLQFFIFCHDVDDEESYLRIEFPRGLNYFPPKLRLLRWFCYPLQALPSGFCPKFLVVLEMPNSKLEKLWEGSQPLENLRRIDLSFSEHLKQLPDLSRATNLEVLELSDCKRLERIPCINSRYFNLLNLSGCSSIRILGEISSQSLTEIDLEGSDIEEVPQFIIDLSCLKLLNLNCCRRLKNLPNIKGLRSLKKLSVSCSPMITEFPQVPYGIEELILGGTMMEKVPSWIEKLSRLVRLDLSSNKCLKSIPDGIFKLSSLEDLDLSNCESLDSLPQDLEIGSCLKSLDVGGTCIKGLPTTLGQVTSLLYLHAQNTTIEQEPSFSIDNLQELWLGRRGYRSNGMPFQFPSLSNCMTLLHLSLSNLNIQEIPDYVGDLGNLTKLDLSGNDFSCVPASIKHLPCLISFKLNRCPKLWSLPELPQALNHLSAHKCVSLVDASQGFQQYLECLALGDCFNLHPDVDMLVRCMASPKWFEKNMSSMIFLSGSVVPGYLNFKALGPSVTVYLQRGHTLSEFFGFVACLVLPFKCCLHTWGIYVRCHCCFKAKNASKDVVMEIPGYLFKDEISDLQSDHLFLFNFDLRTKLNEDDGMVVAYDKISFKFDLRDYYNQGAVHPLKMKECGVRLLFMEETEKSTNNDAITSTSSSDYYSAQESSCSDSDSAKEEPLLTEKSICRSSEEIAASSRVQLGIAGAVVLKTHLNEPTEGKNLLTRKRYHEPDSYKAEEESLNSKRVKLT